MNYFKFRIPEEYNELLDKILSGLLPHENFDSEIAKELVNDLFIVVPLEETEGIYYVLFWILNRISVTHLYLSKRNISLQRDFFDSAVHSNLDTLMRLESVGIEKILKDYGKDFNLEIPTEYTDAAEFLYSELLAKYDELFEMGTPTVECNEYLNMLKQGVEEALTKSMLNAAAKVIVEGYSYNGELYKGAADSRKILGLALPDVNQRVANTLNLASSDCKLNIISSFEDSKKFDEQNRIQLKSLYYTRFDPLDDLRAICTQDIITIVADEGVGKTRLAVDQAYKATMQGINVVYVCGETATIKIKKMVEAIHIHELYGLQFTVDELLDFDKIKVESIEQLEEITTKINHASMDLFSNENYGKLALVQDAVYEEFSTQVQNWKDQFDVDLVIVDHVLALTSTGAFTDLGRLTTFGTRVGYLYSQEDKLVKKLNIAFINTSHPSSETSKDLKNNIAPGARSGAESSFSSKYSSHIWVLAKRDELTVQDMVILYVTKMRDRKGLVEPLVLQRNGCSSLHVFNPAIQHYIKGTSKITSDNIEDFISDSE